MSDEMRCAFWIVWDEFGSAPTTVKHDLESKAVAAAERLAREHSGHTFVVLQAITARTVNIMKSIDYSDIPF